MGGFFGIKPREVEEPSWGSFTQGLKRAFSLDTQLPSRATVRDVAGVGSPDPKDIEHRLAEESAKAEAARAAAGDPPRSAMRRNEAPTDPAQPKVGTGMLATSHTPVAERRAAAAAGEKYGIVRMPDGRIVASDDPIKAASGGGSIDPAGARANVAEGPAGTVYSASEKALVGPGGANLADVNLPTDEDRSPGWATRKAYNQLYASGDLSMNARDVMDRRRWEESEEARESDTELARARRDAAILQSQIDPYKMAAIEAEGKYGGEVIEQEAENQRIAGALAYYNRLGEQISHYEQTLAGLDPSSAQYAAVKDSLDRLLQERRELANIAQGFQLRDPRYNPFADMMGALAAPTAAPGGSE